MTCLSLITCGVEHHFICLLAICISLVRFLLRSLSFFFLFFSNWAVCFLLLSFKCYFYILCEFFIRCVCKYFPLVCDLFSCSFGIVFHRSFFVSIKSNLLIIYLMDCAFGIVSKKSLPCPRSSIFSPMLFSRRVTDFLFYI